MRSKTLVPFVMWIFVAVLAAIFPLLVPFRAAAGMLEMSAGFSYDKSNYGDDSYTWKRRMGGSIGFYFTEVSSIELAYQDSVTRNKIAGLEDTTFHDKVYSANWVQHLTGKDFPIQPFFKLGVGQLNRDASGTYASGGTPPSRIDSLTAILGAGLKIYLTKTFGLRGEFTSYLTGARIATWQDNVAATAGLSIYF